MVGKGGNVDALQTAKRDLSANMSASVRRLVAMDLRRRSWYLALVVEQLVLLGDLLRDLVDY